MEPPVLPDIFKDPKSIIKTVKSNFLSLAMTSLGFLLFGIWGVSTIRDTDTSKAVVFEETGEASLSAQIRVDIEGAVKNPGVYSFPSDARIEDGISTAGGFSSKADLAWCEKYLNRAAKLVDGGKIFIPSKGINIKSQEPSTKSQTQGNIIDNAVLGVSEGKVNINTASQKELEDLPGIGPVTAGKIISNRPYGSVEELKSKKAVGNSVYEKIRDLIIAF